MCCSPVEYSLLFCQVALLASVTLSQRVMGLSPDASGPFFTDWALAVLSWKRGQVRSAVKHPQMLPVGKEVGLRLMLLSGLLGFVTEHCSKSPGNGIYHMKYLPCKKAEAYYGCLQLPLIIRRKKNKKYMDTCVDRCYFTGSKELHHENRHTSICSAWAKQQTLISAPTLAVLAPCIKQGLHVSQFY